MQHMHFVHSCSSTIYVHVHIVEISDNTPPS